MKKFLIISIIVLGIITTILDGVYLKQIDEIAFNNILKIISIIIGILFLVYFFSYFQERVIELRSYLNNLNELTPKQLKSTQNRLQRFLLIKNLNNMKKYFGIALIVITLLISTIALLSYKDYKCYITNFFEIQNKKLTLRKESEVDSLLQLIDKTKLENDSLKKVNSLNNEQIDIYKSINIQQFHTIRSLENIVKTNETKNK